MKVGSRVQEVLDYVNLVSSQHINPADNDVVVSCYNCGAYMDEGQQKAFLDRFKEDLEEVRPVGEQYKP